MSSPGHFLTSVTFTKDYRCFKKGDTIPFKPGVNLLVGDQGTGKSTIIQILRNSSQEKEDGPATITTTISPSKTVEMYSFDFERDLTRGKSHFDDRRPMKFQVQQMFMSHGETVRAVVETLDQMKDCLVLLDEPDIGLSLRSAYTLARLLASAAKRGCQLVASIHNPLVMQEIGEVYGMEERRWMTAPEFLKGQAQPPAQAPAQAPAQPPAQSPHRLNPRHKRRSSLTDD